MIHTRVRTMKRVFDKDVLKIFIEYLAERIRGSKSNSVFLRVCNIVDELEMKLKVRGLSRRAIARRVQVVLTTLRDLGLIEVYSKSARGFVYILNRGSTLWTVLEQVKDRNQALCIADILTEYAETKMKSDVVTGRLLTCAASPINLEQ